MIESLTIEPGQYRLAELGELFGVSRVTAGKFPGRYSLTLVKVPFNGREVAGVDLGVEDITRIKKDLLKGTESVTKPLAKQPAKDTQDLSKLMERVMELSELVMSQSKELVETKSELERKKAEMVVYNFERENLQNKLKDAKGSIPANKPSRGPTKWFKFWE
jgi:hypothetical protein